MSLSSNNLFPEEDRAVLLAELTRLRGEPRPMEPTWAVLEFGPGSSTQVFIDFGCLYICTCEHDQKWYELAKQKFAACHGVVVRKYHNNPKVTVEGLDDGEHFGLAFVDSPKGTDRRVRLKDQEDCSRLNTVMFAIKRAPVVLLHDAQREGEQNTLRRLETLGYKTEMLSQKMARITRC